MPHSPLDWPPAPAGTFALTGCAIALLVAVAAGAALWLALVCAL